MCNKVKVLCCVALVRCPAWTSNATWDASRGDFLLLLSGTSHSIFHVQCCLKFFSECGSCRMNEASILSFYDTIFKIPNTSVPLWHLGLRYHVLMAPASPSNATPDFCLASSTPFTPHMTWKAPKMAQNIIKRECSADWVCPEHNIVTFCMRQESSVSH